MGGPTSSDIAAALHRAAAHLSGAARVWIGTHLDPDGDAIGSALGLAHILSARGQPVTVACQDPPPREAAFLPGAHALTDAGPGGHDLAIALDAADFDRLGRLCTIDDWKLRTTVVIDHHVSNPGFGTVNVIDPTAASTAEVVVALADVLGAAIPPDAATCLLTGVVTDSLGFRTTSTTPRTLDAARRLMSCGADLSDIVQRVFFTQPLATLRLTGRALEHLSMDGPFGISWLSQADIRAFGASHTEVQDITRLLSTAAEPAAIAFVRERPDGTCDVSLRSKPGVDVVPAARALGGGGHPQAAGARVPGPIEAALGAVRQALQGHVDVRGGDGRR